VRTAIATACVISSLAVSGVTSAETASGFAQAQTSFIKKLYSEKRHFDCVAETRRLLHHAPALENRVDFEYFIGAN